MIRRGWSNGKLSTRYRDDMLYEMGESLAYHFDR